MPLYRKKPVDCGDTVFHEPSKETWLVAAIYRDKLIPFGWPLSYANIADCKIVEQADEATHLKHLTQLAKMNKESDPRCSYAKRVLATYELVEGE